MTGWTRGMVDGFVTAAVLLRLPPEEIRAALPSSLSTPSWFEPLVSANHSRSKRAALLAPLVLKLFSAAEKAKIRWP